MSTVIEPPEETKMEKSSNRTGWFVLTVILVALLAFWIGHEYWPSKKVTSAIPAPGIQTAVPRPAPLPLHLGDTALGEHTIADIATRVAEAWST